jgi:hypothetical protein
MLDAIALGASGLSITGRFGIIAILRPNFAG